MSKTVLTVSGELVPVEKMKACNRFDSCNAPICPKDNDYQLRNHLRDEPVCYYLGESVKPDSKHALNRKIEGGMGGLSPKAMAKVKLHINHSIPHLKKQLNKMSKTNSRMRLVEVTCE